MHTVRNRRASAPRAKTATSTQTKRSRPRKGRADPPFLLRPDAPSAFPLDLIVPPHRGPVITAVAWPVGLVPQGAPTLPPRKARSHAARAETPVTVPPPRSGRTPAPALPLAPPALAPADPPAAPFVEAPIPRARALAVRRQGFVEVLAQALIATGVRLSRWSARQRQAEVERRRLARANARHRALVAQLDALEALRERVQRAV
ncbi:MAG: hypothetical protein RIS94_929 [Pseudomonadota bacterium]|jgi:hypothetical protein